MNAFGWLAAVVVVATLGFAAFIAYSYQGSKPPSD
jgi:hypothetical protein